MTKFLEKFWLAFINDVFQCLKIVSFGLCKLFSRWHSQKNLPTN